MTTEMMILGWTLVLALVQILLPSAFRYQETGAAYNVGARDEPGPPVGKVTARLRRAQANLFETLPLFIAALLIIHVTARESTLTLWGASLFLAARIVYLPLYALGIPVLRTLAWMVSIAGLLMLLWAILVPA
ncbi:MAPEG family protein [Janthinobacterium agaricidamnosum]|uniref:Putative membrane protein n=1 Tax=Janthinobacterium agaricidamnosum NBRC 102515 = DSM 9628 TaxID=1349767 RepID=W0V8Q3_9BURK|nr:MAPEG family protein [Janthinobacterium agaricidamnosum]CDG84266.1 putative membrane protein [Janthinobacterium agaricidamnosum NBRC 102515 = DSM 9628]